MSDKKTDKDKTGSMRKDFAPGASGDSTRVLFQEDELDIYSNKVTLETYIFHGKEIDYPGLERLEYDHDDYSVTVHKKDGSALDLGVKIQWLVRPYFSKAQEVNIVRTKDGESIDGVTLPLTHKNAKSPL